MSTLLNPNNVISIPTSLESGNLDFFRYWFEFLKPFHNLTSREMDVMASFVRLRYKLSKVILDSEVLEKVAINEDTKLEVREECGVSRAHFLVILGKLKESKMILDNRINPRFIPNIKQENNFKLLLLFDFK